MVDDVAPREDELASPTGDLLEREGPSRIEFDSRTRSASEAVIAAVAEVTGVDPTELPPLFSTIDPDALDDLFGRRYRTQSTFTGDLAFEYAECRITVNHGGYVEVVPVIEVDY